MTNTPATGSADARSVATDTPSAVPVAEQVVLVERDVAGIGGHWYRAALSLTRAATRAGRPCTVLALGGIDGHARAALSTAGAQVLTAPGPFSARMLHCLARAVTWLSHAACQVTRHRRFPHQLTLLARCVGEAAALRTAATGSVRVLLTASEALPGLTGLLGGPHVRITHDVITTSDRPVRLLERCARRGRDRVVVVCPTGTVRDTIARTHRGVATIVQPSALVCPGDRLGAERGAARHRLGAAPGDTVMSLIGGWWPHKDIAPADEAFHRLAATGRLTGVHVVVVGRPLDHAVLARWRPLLGARLHVEERPLTEGEMRGVHAATDLLLVSRRPGVGTESGLVCDAARLGIALVVSDHDPELSRRLAAAPWVRIFTAGDPADLARVLAGAITSPPVRPGPDAPAALGLLTPDEALTTFVTLHRSLSGSSPTRHSLGGRSR